MRCDDDDDSGDSEVDDDDGLDVVVDDNVQGFDKCEPVNRGTRLQRLP